MALNMGILLLGILSSSKLTTFQSNNNRVDYNGQSLHIYQPISLIARMADFSKIDIL